ncbi:ABC transporter ATP-binding protein [Radiobacillus sp. PE A8.2]|uniref:ABC transporter ATP-binding protein n=1 Tax=Radiobacillus sp. PE A8.2 TaxID=3380349 RepID=UPI00388FF2C7
MANASDVLLKDVNKIYETREGKQLHAIKDVSLNVEKGQFVSIVGPSGCGKSTLLNILCGLLPSTSGEVLIDNTPLVGPRDDLGIAFQQPLLLPWLKIIDNVLLPVDVQSKKRSDYMERAMDLLELVGLKGFEKRYPSELSGGMQQRVGIVRSLVHDPSLLLMDEPFSALDALTRETMSVELQRIWKETGKTIIFITHSISEAVFLSDRVAVMSSRPGRISKIIDVNLPRPRSLDIMNSDKLGVYANQIRKEFDLEEKRDLSSRIS